MIYCLVPPDLAPRLERSLHRVYGPGSGVELVVERRRGERRCGRERRCSAWRGQRLTDRRRIRNPDGRRVGERRATLVPVGAPAPLPRRARHRSADRLVFVAALRPSPEDREDLDTARLITRIQAGEPRAFKQLYMRYFDRVYTYLRVSAKESHMAVGTTHEVFDEVHEALPDFPFGATSFRAWLFGIVRECSAGLAPGAGRGTDGESGAEAVRPDGPGAIDLRALDWVSDEELVLLVERLPLAERRVLMLRFMIDIGCADAAEVLGWPTDTVRSSQQRGLDFLRARLTALSRTPEQASGAHLPMRRVRGEAPVLRARRFALIPG